MSCSIIPRRGKIMKSTNGYRNEPKGTETNGDQIFRLASERRPSTVVGFRPDSSLAPWSRWANRFIVAAIVQGALVVGATFIMMNGGWRGGALALTLSPSNPSAAYGQVHEQVLGALPPYIAAFSAIAIIGAIAGGLGYIIAWRRSPKQSMT